MSLASRASNLVVFWIFSKLYGLLGLRLGYGVRPARLADCLLRVKLAFSVNVLAEAAGIAALDDDAFRSKAIGTVVQGWEMFSRSIDGPTGVGKTTLADCLLNR